MISHPQHQLLSDVPGIVFLVREADCVLQMSLYKYYEKIFFKTAIVYCGVEVLSLFNPLKTNDDDDTCSK